MTGPQRPTFDQIRETLYSAVVSDALDAVGLRRQSPSVSLQPMTGIDMLVGRCRTTRWADMTHDDPDCYELELAAVDALETDDILIAAAHGSMRSGISGELLSTAAQSGGCAGALVDGAVRDVGKMTAMEFAVFARGTSVYDSMNRQRVVEVDVPVEIGGVRFCPGDLIVADVDGVVVVPRAVEDEVLGRAWSKASEENLVRSAIKEGMTAKDAWRKYGVL